MNHSISKTQSNKIGHYQKRVAAFRLLGSVAVFVPLAALVHKWIQGCTASVLPAALGVVAFCGVLMRLIDFKKQVDPVDMSPMQSIFSRLGALDPQYEYDRNIKWLKFRWLAFVGLVSILFAVTDIMAMSNLCNSQYSYARLMGGKVPVQMPPKKVP